MGIPHFHPLQPTWPHIRNPVGLMSTPRSDFFVYVTTTYVCSEKWDAVPGKFPFDSVTWAKKLTKEIVSCRIATGESTGSEEGGSWPVSRVLSRAIIPLRAASPQPSSSLPGSTRDSRLPRPALRRNGTTSLFGLAPGGVFHAVDCCQRRGALLPHRFTLASARGDFSSRALRRSALCCTFRGLAPPRDYLAPCPLEPGLSSPTHPCGCFAAIAQPAPPARTLPAGGARRAAFSPRLPCRAAASRRMRPVPRDSRAMRARPADPHWRCRFRRRRSSGSGWHRATTRARGCPAGSSAR